MKIRTLLTFIFTIITFSLTSYGKVVDISSLSSIVTELGVLDEFRISGNYTKATISNNGSIAKKLDTNSIIKDYGEYTVRVDNKLIRFKVDSDIKTVGNKEQMYEKLYKAMSCGLTEIDVKFTSGYINSAKFKEDLSNSMKELCNKNPLIAPTGLSVRYSGTTGKFIIRYAIDNKTVVNNSRIAKKQLDSFINTLDLNKNYIEIEKEIVEFICSKARYADNYSGGISPVHSIYNLAVSNQLVCDGYAKTFMYMMNSIGIPTSLISGTTATGPHAWNIVDINGEKYHVDLTWADKTDNKEVYYNYVNETDSYMSKTHVWDRARYAKCDSVNYLNSKIYLISDKLANWRIEKPIIVKDSTDEKVSRLLQEIVQYLNSSIQYNRIDKYGDTIITIKR